MLDRYTDAASGTMAKNAEGKLAMTVVTLKPAVAFAGAVPDRAAFDAMHAEAHAQCFIANSVRSEVRCKATCC